MIFFTEFYRFHNLGHDAVFFGVEDADGFARFTVANVDRQLDDVNL